MSVGTPFEADGVRGVLHRPERRAEAGVVLAHGAGGNCNAPVLVTAADAFCTAGFAVLRIDLPFRQHRSKGPPSPHTAAEDRDGLRRATAMMRKMVSNRIVLGGHSYGGRQATMLAADEPDVVASLLLLSYPLHPPENPTQLRTQHFPQLRVPAVFVHGDKDPFGTIAELEAAIAPIPAPTRLLPVTGAGHDLKRGKLDWAPVLGAIQSFLA